MMRWAQQGWERLSLYLPVLLMGLLALGTWWLVRNAPAPLAASQSAAAPDQPDYSMKNFAVKSFDATGRLQSEVMGETARHYPGTDTLEIDQARMRSVAPNGRLTLARADRALSNGDGSEVNSCTPSPRKKKCGPTAPCNSRAATTASPQTPWNTTTSTRCCNSMGVCAAC